MQLDYPSSGRSHSPPYSLLKRKADVSNNGRKYILYRFLRLAAIKVYFVFGGDFGKRKQVGFFEFGIGGAG